VTNISSAFQKVLSGTVSKRSRKAGSDALMKEEAISKEILSIRV
jgi:hypothetical protein